MTALRAFSARGLDAFRRWLQQPPDWHLLAAVLRDTELCPAVHDRSIDEDRRFESRFEFGVYLNELLKGYDPEEVLSAEFDGMWAWINALYIRQLAPVVFRREEHYVPIRRGTRSLLHRNAARTAFELVYIHGENAKLVLRQDMRTHGQLLESLSASQTVVRNRGFFAAAARLYLQPDGEVKRGARSDPKKGRTRKAGDETGKGSIRRLPVALKRLDLTYDAEILNAEELISLLPREYTKWKR